jgi:hypothetical protein
MRSSQSIVVAVAGVVVSLALILTIRWQAGPAPAVAHWQYLTLQAPWVAAKKHFTITEAIATVSAPRATLPVLATATTVQTLAGAWNQALAQVGDRGWEMVSASRALKAGVGYTDAMYFKRPL